MSGVFWFWAGVTAAAAAVQRIHTKWGVVAEYRRWDWAAVPYFLAKQVVGTFLRSRP